MRTEKYHCDIKGCDKEAEVKGQELQIIFTTEQTEGRLVKPYLQMEKLDICAACLLTVLSGEAIWAHGAQGHNTYHFK
jgi:hypothetical protein